MNFFSLIIVLILILLFDAAWLGIMVPNFYKPAIGHLLADSLKPTAGVIFYFLFACALNVFVIGPALKNNIDYTHIFLLGVLFGLVTYGTYDLTNQATLKNWPWIVTIVDLTWGSLLTGTVSVLATYITRHFW